MKRTGIKIIFLGAVCVAGWQLGGVIPSHTITLFGGFLFGAFVGIPAMLIIATRAQTVRHDVYHHTREDRPRITVVTDRSLLPTVTNRKLEAKR